MKIYSKKPRYVKKAIAKNPKDAEQDKNISRLSKRIKKIDSITREVGLVETFVNQVVTLQGSPNIYLLNGLMKGVGLDQRTGDTAYMRYLEMRCQIRCNNANFLENQALRVIIVREKTTQTQTISLTSYMDNSAPNTWFIPNKKDVDPKRYKTYYDKTFDASGQSPFTRNFSIYKKLGFTANYSRNNLGTVADIDTNGLFLVLISDNADSTQAAIFSCHCYIHYNR